MIGTTIGRYEIIAELGRGANGVVWKARHTLLPSRLVALKVLSENLWTSTQARDRFLREAIAVSKLDHPGIATLYDAEEVDGQLYIAFKLIDGGTVAQHTAKGPLPLRKAVTIGRDAAEALAHAHAQGVIHRDLSAGNVMVDREGRGVLVDFGLARAGEQSATATVGLVAGTLVYMPPEALRGEAADARSDIYSLGAVMYRMITGRAPFEGEHAEEIIHRILTTRAPPPSASCPTVPPELDDVVLRALERNPRDRYASAPEMARALGGVLELPALREGAEQRVSPAGRLLSNLRRGLRRRSARWAVGIGTAVVVAAAALGIAWLNGWRPALVSLTHSVAVLPFKNASADSAETAYLAEGLGDELVSRLSRVQGLRVLPWLTTGSLAGDTRPFPQLARELQVDHLLTGSFTSDGERIKVKVLLLEGRKGWQRWSEQFEESVIDLPVIQKEIALRVASQLRGRLEKGEREALAEAPTGNPDAYEYYLRGANALHANDPESQAHAEPYFRKAIELDSTLAEAHLGLGAVAIRSYYYGGSHHDLDLAAREFRRALDLDPRLAAAERGLIRITGELSRATEEPLKIGQVAARRGSNDIEAVLTQAYGYVFGGLPDKGAAAFERALVLDPSNPFSWWWRVTALCWSGRFSECLEAGKAYVRRFGEDEETYLSMGTAAMVLGRQADARLYDERAFELFGEGVLVTPVQLANFYRQTGEIEKMRAVGAKGIANLEARLEANPENLRTRGNLATLYAVLGDMAACQSQVRVIAAELRKPGSASGATESGIPFALAQSGFVNEAVAAAREFWVPEPSLWADYSGLANYQRMWDSPGTREFCALPEIRKFFQRLDARRAELAARY